jgi:hypothetical protein
MDFQPSRFGASHLSKNCIQRTPFCRDAIRLAAIDRKREIC